MNKTIASEAGETVTRSSSFALAGAVTGIGSVPFAEASDAIQSVADPASEMPFWPQMPRLSERESIIGQGLDLLGSLIESRAAGYDNQVKSGRLDTVLATLHESTGELTSPNAVGFGAYEEALSHGLFPSPIAVKGQIEGPVTLAAYLFHEDRPFLSDPALFGAIASYVSKMIRWQVARRTFGFCLFRAGASKRPTRQEAGRGRIEP